MKKRISILILAAVMILSCLAGCSGSGEVDSAKAESNDAYSSSSSGAAASMPTASFAEASWDEEAYEMPMEAEELWTIRVITRPASTPRMGFSNTSSS